MSVWTITGKRHRFIFRPIRLTISAELNFPTCLAALQWKRDEMSPEESTIMTTTVTYNFCNNLNWNAQTRVPNLCAKFKPSFQLLPSCPLPMPVTLPCISVLMSPHISPYSNKKGHIHGGQGGIWRKYQKRGHIYIGINMTWEEPWKIRIPRPTQVVLNHNLK